MPNLQLSTEWSQHHIAAKDLVAKIAAKYPEGAEYAARNGSKEQQLAAMFGDMSSPTVKKDYAFRYRRKSQTAHGAVVGMTDVCDFKGGTVGIRFDSRLEDPNLAVAEVAMNVVNFIQLLDDQLDCNRWAKDVEPLDQAIAGEAALIWPDRDAESDN